MDFSLHNVVMFSQLTPQGLADVRAALKPRQLEAGEVLFSLGDPGDELILVEQGVVAIYEPDPGKPSAGQPIRLFREGELLGEMALIDRKPRSLSARAEEPASILTLSGDDFRRLLENNPEMSISVMGGLSERIRYTTDFLGEVRRWVQHMAEGKYQESQRLGESGRYADGTLAALAAEFAQMAAQVQKREDQLRQEVAQLRIEIDQSKRKTDVEEIVGSDYYQRLKDKVKQMRKDMEE